MDTQRHYQLIAKALHWLCQNQREQPGLDELSRHVGLSPHYLQRLFQDWAGVTPKQFLKYLTKKQAIERLQHGQSILDAALSSGLSGPGRLHDLLITTQAVTPGQAKNRGMGVNMQFGFGPTPFGESLLAWTDKGVCFLGFDEEMGQQAALLQLQGQWPDAELEPMHFLARQKLVDIFSQKDQPSIKVWLRGSPFQLKIWEALLKLPAGTHCSYGQLAAFTGNAGASRATGSAIGRNPVSWLIPCHRVINSLGGPGGYRWGITTKQAMIGYEAAISQQRAH